MESIDDNPLKFWHEHRFAYPTLPQLALGAYRRGGRNASPASEILLSFLLTKILKIEKSFFVLNFNKNLCCALPLPLPWTPRYAPD